MIGAVRFNAFRVIRGQGQASFTRLIQSPLKISKYASSTSPSLDLTGIFPPIVTPFNTDESIAWDKLESNLEKLKSTKIRGVLVHGSNGEFVYLSTEERVQMIKLVKDVLGSEKLVLAGSGCESTKETMKMTDSMAEAGADAAVVVTPCYFKSKMTPKALEMHFRSVADSSPVPVILYSVPANTSLDLGVGVVSSLASHSNIIGMKDSGGDISKIGQMIHLTKGQDFQMIAGSASFLLSALMVGSVGGICALANALPDPVCELQEKFNSGDLTSARDLQHRLIGPNNAVTKQLGVPGLKQAMDWCGYYGGPTRKPMLPLEPAETKELEECFKSNGFL